MWVNYFLLKGDMYYEKKMGRNVKRTWAMVLVTVIFMCSNNFIICEAQKVSNEIQEETMDLRMGLKKLENYIPIVLVRLLKMVI